MLCFSPKSNSICSWRMVNGSAGPGRTGLGGAATNRVLILLKNLSNRGRCLFDMAADYVHANTFVKLAYRG